MSLKAMQWVWEYSPYTGTDKLLHLALADTANDLHGFELWMRQIKLAEKVGCTRQTANAFLGRAVKAKFIEVLEDNSREGHANRYRFLFPNVAQRWDPEVGLLEGGVGNSYTPQGVGNSDTPVAFADTGCRETGHVTQVEPKDETQPLPAPSSPRCSSDMTINESGMSESFQSELAPGSGASDPHPIVEGDGMLSAFEEEGDDSAAPSRSTVRPPGSTGPPATLDAPTTTTPKPGPDDEPSDEVLALCTLLADLYHGLGNTRPNPNQKSWYRAARLLLTKDGPDEKGWPYAKAEKLLRWALDDPFWQTNIRSMPTFRKQYDQLRMKANAEYRAKQGGGKSQVTDRLDQIIQEGS